MRPPRCRAARPAPRPRFTSTDIATTDLSRYRHIIVAGDQPSIFYLTFANRSAQIDAFVSGGGVLEYHGAGWGFNAGDASLVTLPAGVTTALHFANQNTILELSHPIVAGMQNPFFGAR